VSQFSATIGVLATLAQTLTAPTFAPPPVFEVPRPPARTAPFKGLFKPPPGVSAPQSLPAARVAVVDLRPRVVCGMVVVPADPAVDPRMAKAVPSDVTFNMRVVKPPLCLD
jgi:hypothetical protein